MLRQLPYTHQGCLLGRTGGSCFAATLRSLALRACVLLLSNLLGCTLVTLEAGREVLSKMLALGRNVQPELGWAACASAVLKLAHCTSSTDHRPHTESKQKKNVLAE